MPVVTEIHGFTPLKMNSRLRGNDGEGFDLRSKDLSRGLESGDLSQGI